MWAKWDKKINIDGANRTNLDQCVFAVVGDDIFEVLGNSNGDWTIVIGRHGLWFQIWLQVAGFQIFQECLKTFDSACGIKDKHIETGCDWRCHKMGAETYENSSFRMNFWLRSSRANTTGFSPV